MPDSMIERVARAIHARLYNGVTPWGREIVDVREQCFDLAEDAVGALREPTEAMTNAAGRAFLDAAIGHEHGDKVNTPFVRFHRAAIDAILAEGQPASRAPATEGGHG